MKASGPPISSLSARLLAFGRALSWLLLSSFLLTSPARAHADGEGPERERPHPPARAAEVRLGYFSTNLPLQAAFANGYFDDENLTVTTQQVTNSIALFKGVAADTIDIALTSADNPLNYRLNANNAVNNGGAPLDIQMIFGDHLGLGLALVAQPGASFESLHGKKCGVDAPDSGFAYVLYDMLKRHGLKAGVDYTVAPAGGTPIRLAALRAKTIDCTLLNADSVVRARAEGFAVLATIEDVAVPYLGGVGAARESWLKANPEVAVRFIRAYVRGVRWVEKPENRTAVISLLSNAGTDATLAAKIVDAAVADPTGILPEARFDVDGLRSVIALRQAFGGFEQSPDAAFLSSRASGVYDLRYYRRAVRDRGRDRD